MSSMAAITSRPVLRPRYHDLSAVHTGGRLHLDGWDSWGQKQDDVQFVPVQFDYLASENPRCR
jgi:hypothetical protein